MVREHGEGQPAERVEDSLRCQHFPGDDRSSVIFDQMLLNQYNHMKNISGLVPCCSEIKKTVLQLFQTEIDGVKGFSDRDGLCK